MNEQDLLEYGFEKSSDFPLWPFQKQLSDETEDEGCISLVVTMEYNTPEFALILPSGDQVFLRVRDMEHLKQVEEAIHRFEPNY